jgi:nucleoside-diphosphate-sugar epimerase
MIKNNKIIKEDIISIYNSLKKIIKIKNSKILITGGYGFIASYILLVLNHLNCFFNYNIKIFIIVKNKKKFEKRFKNIFNKGSVQLIISNLDKPLKNNLNFDYIIHAAGYAAPKYFQNKATEVIKSGVIGTYNLLEYVKKMKPKTFLFLSSGEVYGNASDHGLKEKNLGAVDTLNIRSCYAESKRISENMCIAWGQKYNFPVKIARIFHVYGPGMNLKNDGRVMQDFVFGFINLKKILIKGNGKAIRSFCYISDAVTAIFTILMKGKNGEAYNVGNPNQTFSIIQLSKIISKLGKNIKIQFTKRLKKENYIESPIHKHIPNINKIKKIRWFPTLSVSKGFLRTVKYFD